MHAVPFSTFIYRFLLLLALTGCTGYLQAQDSTAFDTTYFQSYKNLVTGRFYFSKKYTNLQLGNPLGKETILYKPNTTLNMGVGATYQALTLNLAYGFGFLNNNSAKGKTRYLDLQSHIYGRKWTLDLFGQFYKGYYLSPRNFSFYQPKEYYLRPDIRVNFLGVAMNRVFNEKHFSYAAAFLQNEWQKKSAGSFIAGGEIYYGKFRGDSSLVPSAVAADYPQAGIEQVRFVELGAGGGYTYTQVFKEHLFLTGSLSLNMALGYVRELEGSSSEGYVAFTPNVIYRVVAGYNSRRWNLNFSLVNNTVSAKGQSSSHPYRIQTGNYRLTLARRFIPGPKLSRRLRAINNIFRNK